MFFVVICCLLLLLFLVLLWFFIVLLLFPCFSAAGCCVQRCAELVRGRFQEPRSLEAGRPCPRLLVVRGKGYKGEKG